MSPINQLIFIVVRWAQKWAKSRLIVVRSCRDTVVKEPCASIRSIIVF